MKTFVALSLALVCATAIANDCDGSSVQSVPGAATRAVPRVKQRVASAPVIGPKLHLTPYVRTVPFPVPARVSIKTAMRYHCPPAMSVPPGAVPIGPGGLLLVGARPAWGVPSFLPLGPMPVYPNTPDDFPPGLIVPPAGTDFPPGPTDVPEPSILAMMALGLFMLRKKFA